MKKRIGAVLAVTMLAVAAAGLNLPAGAIVDDILNRYPGSMPSGAESFDDYSFDHGAISRQGVYRTPDELAVVERWYLAQLQIAPASDLMPSGDCVWLTRTRQVVQFRRTISVLLCAMPLGTRVVVNESIFLWP